jgi:YVTN family beta-propeller protein
VVEFFPEANIRTVTDDKEFLEGDYVEIGFRINDAVNAEPLSGIYPAVWMDMRKAWGNEDSGSLECRQKVSLFLGGTVGLRPMIDLNSYFVLVMNRDATITVIDPIVGITGITKLFAQIILKRPAADWDKTRDDKRLFVSMPRANEIAVVDTDIFKVKAFVKAGVHPVRVKVQPDEKYVWIGNDSKNEGESGVTVIDIETLEPVAHITTGMGHHEIAFSSDSRYAFVSNRNDGTVTAIDVQKLEKIKNIKTGSVTMSVAFSSLSQSLYVADGQQGQITVIDGKGHNVITRINAKPGLGPMRFSEDGRWGFVVNTSEDVVYVIDSGSNRIAHIIPVEGRPYQIGLSRAFAYVRALDSERLSMINMAHLGKETAPPVNYFPVGAKAPSNAADVSIADAIAEAPGEAAILVVSPADNTVYYYMEGMNAPMGNFLNYGHRPRAVTVVDRTLREKEPGFYSAKVQIPAAGTYDVIFLLDTPRVLHCFTLTAKPNPLIKHETEEFTVEFLLKERVFQAGDTVQLRFRLTDPETKEPRTDLKDLRVLYYVAPGQRRTEIQAKEIGDGVYEAALSVPRAGAYYVYISSPSANVNYADLPFLTLRALRKKEAPDAPDRSRPKGS